jgi:hypothetical protein
MLFKMDCRMLVWRRKAVSDWANWKRALLGGGAAFGHALLQGFIEDFEGGLRLGALGHFGLQGLVGAGQFAGAFLHARFQALLRPAQGLLHPLALGHFGGQNGHHREQAQPLHGVPEKPPMVLDRNWLPKLRHEPNGAGNDGDENPRPASGKPGRAADGDEIKGHQRDHRAGDVIQLADKNRHDRQSQPGFAHGRPDPHRQKQPGHHPPLQFERHPGV